MDLHTTNEIAVEMLSHTKAGELEHSMQAEHRHGVDPYVQSDIDAMFSTVHFLEYMLEPGHRVLLSTREKVVVPEGVVGDIGLRSTWARLGLVSPPTVADPGFEGTLTMEVFNANRHHAILIREGDALWHMHLKLLSGYTGGLYEGRYQGQSGLQTPLALERKGGEK